MFQEYIVHGREWNLALAKAVGVPSGKRAWFHRSDEGGCRSLPFPQSRSWQDSRSGPDKALPSLSLCRVFSSPYFQLPHLSLPHLISPFAFSPFWSFLPLPTALFLSATSRVNFRAFPMLGTYSVTELHSLALVLVFVLFWFLRQSHCLTQAGFQFSDTDNTNRVADQTDQHWGSKSVTPDSAL